MTPNRPLDGASIVVTRSSSQAGALIEQIRALGGQPIELPLIDFRKASISHHSHLTDYDWIVFSSVNGVRFFLDQLSDQEIDQLRSKARVAAVGSKTRSELLNYQFQVEVMPTKYEAESLAEAILKKASTHERILLARGNLARPILTDLLKKAGLSVLDLAVYETVFPKEALLKIKELQQLGVQPDYLTFTSASTVSHYAELSQKLLSDKTMLFPEADIVCIGDITAQKARALGLVVAAVPKRFTVEAMVDELIRLRKGE
ncbi:uroporphyrinogen-III synthase [Alkalicoccobacillus porphyridii]|uniref:Uroporphyrinogen-III synthase n=1 Tax=Alkalicoccobacillus porphyridii TaxID=2597270 RepID=A0A553ZXS7_9BACI|nr:uroporphyrinogen-III synthase [Alkalicoccobacillus porphyridii]TSB46259.1 uroporphyrinogen-III synthase [Alkalicoccobacillus porphyridii]